MSDTERVAPEILAKELASGNGHFIACPPVKPTVFVERMNDGALSPLSPNEPEVWAMARLVFESGDDLDVPMFRDGKCVGRYWHIEWVHGDHICIRRS